MALKFKGGEKRGKGRENEREGLIGKGLHAKREVRRRPRLQKKTFQLGKTQKKKTSKEKREEEKSEPWGGGKESVGASA